MNKDLEFLIDSLKSLPGVGAKQAKNIAYFLLDKDQQYIDEFLKRIINFKNNVTYCEKCNNIITTKGNRICDICNDINRDSKKLYIVNTIDDLTKFEQLKTYNGFYFVLNIIQDKKHYEIDKKKLIFLLKEYKFNEITICTNWNNNGELIAIELKKIINQTLPNAKIYRIAVGMPINSEVNYIDETTLKYALKNKIEY